MKPSERQHSTGLYTLLKVCSGHLSILCIMYLGDLSNFMRALKASHFNGKNLCIMYRGIVRLTIKSDYRVLQSNKGKYLNPK